MESKVDNYKKQDKTYKIEYMKYIEQKINQYRRKNDLSKICFIKISQIYILSYIKFDKYKVFRYTYV